MRPGRAAPLALGSFALALGVLLLNDWWLKRAPSPLTGKLSDVAGLFLVPLPLAVAAALLPLRLRRWALGAGLLAVAAVFVAVKLDLHLAELVAARWPWPSPARIVADPTDLACLPMLLLGARCARALTPDY